MYCPNCSQEQISRETKFCSRCGFLMTGVIALIGNGGALVQNSQLQKSPENKSRNRGLKQGLFIFLLTFLVVPITAILTVAAEAEPFAVVISAILFGVGGLLRMAYALLFESNEGAAPDNSKAKILGSAKNLLSGKPSEKALPEQQTMPAESFVPPKQGNWRDTNDLAQTSVTEDTTKLLHKDI